MIGCSLFRLLLLWTYAGILLAQDLTPLIERADRVAAEGRLEEARASLYRARSLAHEPEILAAVDERLGRTNLALLLSRQLQPECIIVTVGKGDSLDRIARRHGTTPDLIRRANAVRGDTIQLGQRLKVLDQSFRVEVDKSENQLTLWLGDQFFKTYPVATGAYNHTPVGTFQITDRIVHPTWWHPDTGEEILYGQPGHKIGTHWLGWDRKGFGIHGTDEPESIGQQASLGCVRMHNEDVAELYLLLPSRTPVTVRD